jgi:hypothetical protein
MNNSGSNRNQEFMRSQRSAADPFGRQTPMANLSGGRPHMFNTFEQANSEHNYGSMHAQKDKNDGGNNFTP